MSSSVFKFGLTCALFSLGACGSIGTPNANPVREQAEVVVSQIISSQIPGVDVTPVTTCVIDNATNGELLQIAKASVLGPNQGTISLVLGIVQRPETLTCLTNSGQNLLGLVL